MAGGIEQLEPINKYGFDIQSNDQLFDLILEQREKINELIEKVNAIDKEAVKHNYIEGK